MLRGALCRRGRGLRSTLALCAGLTLAAAPGEARAFERQWHLGAQASYAMYVDYTATALHGVGGTVYATYGLNDTFNLLVDASVHSLPEKGYVLGGVSVGAAYVLDVLEWVPYAGLTVGAFDAFSTSPAGCPPSPSGQLAAECHLGRLGVSVPVGLDYQLSRSFALGAQARYHLLFFGPGVEQLLTVGLKAELLWGY